MKRLIALIMFLALLYPFGMAQATYISPPGGGATTFLGLTDTPSAYTGLGGQYVKVKATEDGLETDTPAGAGDITAVGPFASGNAFVDGTVSSGTTMFTWEGTTDDVYEFIVAAPTADPTADVTVTFPASTCTLIGEGVATGGLLLGDSTPDAAGEIGYASGKFLLYGANSEDFYIHVGSAGNTMEFASNTSVSAIVTLLDWAHGADPADLGDLRFSNAETIMWEASPAGTDVNVLTVDSAEIVQIASTGASGVTITPDTTISGDLIISGDDLYMNTNTSGAALIADGTNFNPVVISGDIVIGTDGTATIQAGAVEDSDIAAGAVDGGSGGEIADNTIDANDLAATLTFGASDSVDLSGITATASQDYGLAIPAWADVTPTSDKPWITYDSASNAIKVYEGGWVSITGGTGAPTDAKYVVFDALNGTLSAEMLLAESTDGIDLSAYSANGTLTISFDATEVGTETWGSGSAITWTFNASAGTDPTIAFGDGSITASHLTVTNLLTASAGLTIATGQNLIIGTTTWNSGDSIDGTKVADADLGDIDVSTGAWSVEDDSHNHIYSNIDETTSSNWASRVSDETGSGVWVFGTNPTLTAVTLGGDITQTGGAYDWDLIDNNASALSFDATGKAGILAIVTTDSGEKVTMSGGLDVTGACAITGALTQGGNAVLTAATSWSGDLGGTGSSPTVTDLTITSEAQGDVLYFNGSNWVRLPAGTDGQYLETNGPGVNPAWSTVTATAGGSDTNVQYNSGGALGGEAAFAYNATTDVLSIPNISSSGYYALGADPADAGSIRLSNNTAIMVEADPTGTDVSMITVTTAEVVQIGASGASGVTITPALTCSSTIASGAITSTSNITSGDSFIIGSADIEEAELEILDGATLSTSDINIIDGISDSGSLTATELLYVDGVTSAIQTQIDGKEGTLTNSAGLAAALSDETGSGLAVFGTSPTIATPAITTLITVKTQVNSPYTATTADVSGGIICNAGATGALVINLPACSAGMKVTILLAEAQDIDINPDDADQIIVLTNAAGDAISSDATQGSMITLVAVDSTEWFALGRVGAWADAN